MVNSVIIFIIRERHSETMEARVCLCVCVGGGGGGIRGVTSLCFQTLCATVSKTGMHKFYPILN